MNCFLLRLPGATSVLGGLAEELENGVGDGFFFASFDEPSRIYGIPSEIREFPLTTLSNPTLRSGDESVTRNIFSDFPQFKECEECIKSNGAGLASASYPVSTSREEYIGYVKQAKDRIACLEANSGKRTKIVTSRVKVSPASAIPPIELFLRLCDKYPEACVFLFSTKEFGTWIGASPELLLSASEGYIKSMALAGTRKRGSSENWDRKNLEEQAIVTDYIAGKFVDAGLHPEVSGPHTHAHGPVEHLETTIIARSDASKPEMNNLSASLMASLSPTPALSGFPKEEAIEFLKSTEKHHRELYGGYFGIHKNGEVSAYVNLRSAKFLPTSDSICLYAGGGITKDSDPSAEWTETEMKLSTLETLLSTP